MGPRSQSKRFHWRSELPSKVALWLI